MPSFTEDVEKVYPFRNFSHSIVDLLDNRGFFVSWGKHTEKFFGIPATSARGKIHLRDILWNKKAFDFIWDNLEKEGKFLGYVGLKVKDRRVEAFMSLWKHEETDFVTIFLIDVQKSLPIIHEYKTLFDSIPDPIFILDTNFRIVKANRATARALKMDINEILGKKCYEIVHETSEPPPECPHKKLLQDKKPHTGEVFEKNLGGLNIVTTIPIFSPDGKLIASIHVSRNISELKRLKELYTFFFNFSPSINMILDKNYNILETNVMTLQTFKAKREDLIGINFLDLVDEKYRNEIKRRLEKPIMGEIILPSIADFRWKNVKRTLIFSSITPPSGGGESAHTLITGMDITPIMDLQAKLVISEKKYETIFNKSKDPIFVLDENFVITDLNQAGVELFGQDKSIIVGKQIFEFLGRDFRDVLKEIETQPYIHERKYDFMKDGDSMHFLVSATRFYQEKGKGAYLVYLRDITREKKYEKELEKSLLKMSLLFDEIISAMSDLVETRDPYTAGHQRRVAKISVLIGAELGLSEDSIKALKYAGLTHDIGKIAIPSEILTKPGKLTPLEYEMIKMHPEIGYKILKDIDFPWPVAEIVYEHHERLDGSGYPRGLKDGEILFEARVLAVADVVEAMSSHRPYRPALGIEAALDEIRRNRGKLYDPEVVDACVKIFREGKCEIK